MQTPACSVKVKRCRIGSETAHIQGLRRPWVDGPDANIDYAGAILAVSQILDKPWAEVVLAVVGIFRPGSRSLTRPCRN